MDTREHREHLIAGVHEQVDAIVARLGDLPGPLGEQVAALARTAGALAGVVEIYAGMVERHAARLDDLTDRAEPLL